MIDHVPFVHHVSSIVRHPSDIVSHLQFLLLNNETNFHQTAEMFALYQNCSNGSAPQNKMATRATNRKFFLYWIS